MKLLLDCSYGSYGLIYMFVISILSFGKLRLTEIKITNKIGYSRNPTNNNNISVKMTINKLLF